jgi:protein-tyrosine kinase
MGKTSKVLGKSGYSLDEQVTSDSDTISGELLSVVKDVENGYTGDESKDVENGHTGDESRDVKIGHTGGESVLAGELQPSSSSSPVWDERLTKVARFSSQTAESFRVLRSKILLPQDGRPAPRTIMVTSALPREGKSFVSANLGIALAQGVDQHSLLVDCDLRVPSLAKLFGVPFERGLVNYLQERVDLSTLLQKTSLKKLLILASGLPPGNPAELLGSARMQHLVEELASRYPDRYVIFDTPPLQVASETKVLSRAVDGVVLVVRQGISSRAMIEKFISDIGKEKIIGVIFNDHESNFISTNLVDKSQYYYGDYYSKQKD